LASAALFLLLFGNCRHPGIEAFVAKLPELPKDLDATLDPKTLATKVSTSYPPPEKATAAPRAPCCGSTDRKTLKVNFRYTKCGPLRDFIVAPIGDLLLLDSGQGGRGEQSPGPRRFQVYRRGEMNRKTIWDTTVCVSSEGPWDATLTEERHCIGYTPQDTLVINAFGDVVTFVWNGGPPNHPPSVQLVSCREVGVISFPCGGISDCNCVSSPCPADQPCPCGLEGQW